MKSTVLPNWKEKALKRRRKRERLFKIIDKVLRQIFGEPATQFIYHYLEEEYSLRPEDIPNELEIFSEGLEKYLGDSGAYFVMETVFNESPDLELMRIEEKNSIEHIKNLKRIHQ